MKKKLAFVFPGQGTQLCRHGKRFLCLSSRTRRFERGSIDSIWIWQICVSMAPASELLKTNTNKPAIHTVEVSIFVIVTSRRYCSRCSKDFLSWRICCPCCSQSINYDDSVVLVRKRGIFIKMRSLKELEKMLAICGLSRDTVESLVLRARSCGWIECSNYNCPGQIIVSEKRKPWPWQMFCEARQRQKTQLISMFQVHSTLKCYGTPASISRGTRQYPLNPQRFPLFQMLRSVYRPGQDLRTFFEITFFSPCVGRNH